MPTRHSGRSTGDGKKIDVEEGEHYEDGARHHHHDDDSEMSHTHSEDTVTERSAKVVSGGSTVEVIAGAGAVVLTILGLIGMDPAFFASIATIAVGAGLLFGGLALASRYKDFMADDTEGTSVEAAELSGGVSTEVVGGTAAVVLGVLALLGIDPITMMSVAAIVIGGSLLFGAGATARLNNVAIRGANVSRFSRQVASETIGSAAGAQTFIGIGVAALGVLALIGISPLTLTLVALLSAGAGVLLSGAAVGGRMLNMLSHQREGYRHTHDNGRRRR